MQVISIQQQTPKNIYHKTKQPNFNNTIKYKRQILKNDNISSMVSFGWCEKHNVRSKEISQIFLNQLMNRAEKEAEEMLKKTRLEYLDITDASNKESLNFLMQFTNRQKNEAEFIPLWSLMNDDDLQFAMNKSNIFSDPVKSLISLNLLQNIQVNNEKLTPEQLEKSKGSLQVHTAVILIHQIEENLDNPQTMAYQNREDIINLIEYVKQRIDSIYGANTYEKLFKLSNIGTNPDFNSKKESLDFLLKIDNNGRSLNFGTEFAHKLENILSMQRQLEYEKTELEFMYEKEVTIGQELSADKVNKLNQLILLSNSEKEKKAADFMLKTKHEIRFKKENLSHDEIHHREHILGKSNHAHDHEKNDIELDNIDVSYHEHNHDDHLHKH